ncbi:hypothetical protein Lal_00028369, partial [Lupinus albus]
EFGDNFVPSHQPSFQFQKFSHARLKILGRICLNILKDKWSPSLQILTVLLRQPAVERFYFHLPQEQLVYFNDHDDIDNILLRPTVSESMFTSWMEANKQYPEGNIQKVDL